MAQTIMNRFLRADDYPYKPWSYPQGFMLWGFIGLYEKTGDKKYADYILDYCAHHVTANGEVPVFTGVSLDDIMPGSVLVWAWNKTGQEKYKTACGHILKTFDDYPRNSDNGFWHDRHRAREMWVDGLFMGLMFLTRYGKYIGNEDFCFSETVRQLSVVFDRCEKDGTGLLYHAYSEDRKAPWAHPITGKSPEIWSEGLGWYAMILADVLELLPRDLAGYDRLVMQMTKLINGLEKAQDSNSGLWYQVVDKPSGPRNWHDTSGSAMFLYAVKKAGLLGIGEREQCSLIAAKAFSGLKTKCVIDYEGYDRLIMQMKKITCSLEKVQDGNSGLWYQVVDKPLGLRNWHDTSGSAMFLYAIKKAGLLGICNREQCDLIAAKAFEGLKTKCVIDYEGRADIHDACNGLGVQQSYDAYVDYRRNINCQEAVAAFFWACVIME